MIATSTLPGFNLLLSAMVAGIILMKIIWIRSEIRFKRERINFAMFKSNFIEALILVLQILVVYYFPLPASSWDMLWMVIGFVLYIFGMILAFWGKATMEQSWGIPGEHSANQKSLVTGGPFRFSRNPIYVGFSLVYLGFCIAIKSWFIVLRIPLLIYFYRSSLREEKLLEKTFGEHYSRYKSRVPRFLFI